jgi:CRISPR-associated protein Cas1
MSQQVSPSAAVVDVPELLPVRMLNEYAYCPRLAYLEWVEGEFRDNLETREGTFAHRNVDRPGERRVKPKAESRRKRRVMKRSSVTLMKRSERKLAPTIPLLPLSAFRFPLWPPSTRAR